MKKILTLTNLLWLVVVLGSSQSALATIKTAEEVISSTADEVIARLDSESEIIAADPSKIYGLVNELIIPHFDFTSMSKWVLGKKNWQGASDEQRGQFVDEFRTLLVRTYAKAMLEYANQEIEYLPNEDNPNSNLVVVKTVIKQAGSNPVPIDYRMHVSEGEWKVVDIVVDGVSLIATYRGSFASEIKKNGLESLIGKLVKRNETMVNAEDNTASN